jgi:hypothetical protein
MSNQQIGQFGGFGLLASAIKGALPKEVKKLEKNAKARESRAAAKALKETVERDHMIALLSDAKECVNAITRLKRNRDRLIVDALRGRQQENDVAVLARINAGLRALLHGNGNKAVK